MKTLSRLFSTFLALGLILLLVPASPAAPQQKAGLPVLLTSCGQSPGPTTFDIFLKRLKIDYVYNMEATPADLAAKAKSGAPFQSVIVVVGASLKGMGAAGVSIEDEIARAKALIAEAKKRNIKVIGAHIEGMKRRAQGAAPGDNSDELTIDAVCPISTMLLIKKEGDEDGRFTTISKSRNIPMIVYEKNLELENVLKNLFGK